LQTKGRAADSFDSVLESKNQQPFLALNMKKYSSVRFPNAVSDVFQKTVIRSAEKIQPGGDFHDERG
ncbi:MAG TPA: hypothetical protein DCG70_00510, partial [Lachnoclostridium sp.]|nr:hypothetical protein [Lachnoclostridium sp.]